jgi:hypothetical protein
MLVEKSKGRKRSGDGGVGVKFLEEVEEEIRKKKKVIAAKSIRQSAHAEE